MKPYDIQPLTDRFPGKIQTHVDMSRFTTYKVGGPADIFLEVVKTDDLIDAITIARASAIPLTIIGGGSNILVGDKGIRGMVVKNSSNTIRTMGMKGAIHKGISSKTTYVQADSGVPMNTLVRFTIEEGLSGLEMHLGLPGTVGGAVYMNAKWGHPLTYIGDVLYQATILTPRNTIVTTGRDYFRFGYDTSTIQTTGDIVIHVTFQLQGGETHRIWETANQNIQYRFATQPQGVFTAGCVFRNIPQSVVEEKGLPVAASSAGYLIDKAGLKGSEEGGASFSRDHANFIVTSPKANALDVIKLIERARLQVKKKFGITLEEEIIRLGEF